MGDVERAGGSADGRGWEARTSRRRGWLRSSVLWLAVVYFVVTAIGTFLLFDPGATQIGERERRFYWSRHYWNCAFDSLSAVCGVGLLQNGFRDEYTDRGRWILLGMGVVGALVAFFAYGFAVYRIIGVQRDRSRDLVPMYTVFATVTILNIFATWSGYPAGHFDLLASLGSTGFPNLVAGAPGVVFAVVGLLFPLGLLWPILGSDPRSRTRVASFYLCTLMLLSLVLVIVEVPRGYQRQVAESERLATKGFVERAERSAVQVVSAAGAGRATEAIGEGNFGEAGKLMLACAVMIGGAAPGIGGGITALGLWAVLGVLVGRGRRTGGGAVFVRYAIEIVAMIFVVAVGLMVIEGRTAAVGQSAPTLADALLDAASLVCGASLTTGLCATITDPNLSSGMFQNVDLYQYGMVWLMLAMLAGKLVPLAVLCSAAGASSGDASDRCRSDSRPSRVETPAEQESASAARPDAD